jgi:CDGSH-type Zn-finger protein
MSDDVNVNQVKAFVNPKSGSIRITGTVDFVDADGNVTSIVENPKFCGCGLSREKPYCDGSHKEKSQS